MRLYALAFLGSPGSGSLGDPRPGGDGPYDSGIYQWLCCSEQDLTHEQVCYLWAYDSDHSWAGRAVRQRYDWLMCRKWRVWEGFVEPFLKADPLPTWPAYVKEKAA